jgi:hypothetical protein
MTLTWLCSEETIQIYVGKHHGFKFTSAIIDGSVDSDWLPWGVTL